MSPSTVACKPSKDWKKTQKEKNDRKKGEYVCAAQFELRERVLSVDGG